MNTHRIVGMREYHIAARIHAMVDLALALHVSLQTAFDLCFGEARLSEIEAELLSSHGFNCERVTEERGAA